MLHAYSIPGSVCVSTDVGQQRLLKLPLVAIQPYGYDDVPASHIEPQDTS